MGLTRYLAMIRPFFMFAGKQRIVKLGAHAGKQLRTCRQNMLSPNFSHFVATYAYNATGFISLLTNGMMYYWAQQLATGSNHPGEKWGTYCFSIATSCWMSQNLLRIGVTYGKIRNTAIKADSVIGMAGSSTFLVAGILQQNPSFIMSGGLYVIANIFRFQKERPNETAISKTGQKLKLYQRSAEFFQTPMQKCAALQFVAMPLTGMGVVKKYPLEQAVMIITLIAFNLMVQYRAKGIQEDIKASAAPQP